MYDLGTWDTFSASSVKFTKSICEVIIVSFFCRRLLVHVRQHTQNDGCAGTYVCFISTAASYCSWIRNR